MAPHVHAVDEDTQDDYRIVRQKQIDQSSIIINALKEEIGCSQEVLPRIESRNSKRNATCSS